MIPEVDINPIWYAVGIGIILFHVFSTWIMEKMIRRKVEERFDPRLERLKQEFEDTEEITFYIRMNGFVEYRGVPIRIVDLGRNFISWGGRGTVHLVFDSTFVIAVGTDETEVRHLVESTSLFKRYREFPRSGITFYYIRFKLWFLWHLYVRARSDDTDG